MAGRRTRAFWRCKVSSVKADPMPCHAMNTPHYFAGAENLAEDLGPGLSCHHNNFKSSSRSSTFPTQMLQDSSDAPGLRNLPLDGPFLHTTPKTCANRPTSLCLTYHETARTYLLGFHHPVSIRDASVATQRHFNVFCCCLFLRIFCSQAKCARAKAKTHANTICMVPRLISRQNVYIWGPIII